MHSAKGRVFELLLHKCAEFSMRVFHHICCNCSVSIERAWVEVSYKFMMYGSARIFNFVKKILDINLLVLS